MAFQVLRSRLHAQITREDDDKLTLLREKLKAQKEATANATGTLTPPLSPTPITPPLLAVDMPMEGSNGDQPNGGSVPEPKPVRILMTNAGVKLMTSEHDINPLYSLR
jgi:hypothetical protein